MTGPHRIARQGLATCKWRGRRDGEIAGPFDTASLLSAKGGGIEAAARIEPASETGVRGREISWLGPRETFEHEVAAVGH